MVLVSAAIRVFHGSLGFANATQAADGLGESNCFPVREVVVELLEQFLRPVKTGCVDKARSKYEKGQFQQAVSSGISAPTLFQYAR